MTTATDTNDRHADISCERYAHEEGQALAPPFRGRLRSYVTNDISAEDLMSPFPSREERDALVLEFQRLAARLTQVGLISRAASTRLMRTLNRKCAEAEAMRRTFLQLVLDVLMSIDDGTLQERVHFVRGEGALIALHPESAVPAMQRAHRAQHPTQDMRQLFRFGGRHCRHVVIARSARAMFGPHEDRRRTVVLDLANAYELVRACPLNVPVAGPSRVS